MNKAERSKNKREKRETIKKMRKRDGEREVYINKRATEVLSRRGLHKGSHTHTQK